MTARAGLFALLCALPALADWTVTAEARPSEVTLGETVEVHLHVCGEVGTVELPPTVIEPAWGNGFVPAGFHHVYDFSDRRTFRHDISWVVTCDRPGTLRLPPISVTMRTAGSGLPQTKRSQPVEVTVSATGLPDPPTPSLPRGPRPDAGGGALRGWVLGGLSGAILLSAAAAGVLLRRSAPERPPVVGPESTEGRCRAELRGAAALLADDPREFYAAVTAALQHYVGGPPGLTASELRERLASTGATRPVREAAAALLTAADQVRYARGSVGADRSRLLLERLDSALGQGPGKGS